MTTTVRKWGNSLALRIPSSVAKDADLRQGTVVEVRAVGGNIVVKPKKRPRPTLSRLLKGVTQKNTHDEQNWGATGREAL
jgi:antitoxin MazE